MFEAYQKLQSLGMDVELHCAGLDTDGSACQHEIKRLGLKGVKTFGRIDKEGVRNLLYTSDALVLASRSEVQPLVLLEAMSTGIPVISTECIPHSLRIEEGCTIVPIGDADALAFAMSHMVEQPAVDGEMLSVKISELASPIVVGRQLEQVLSEVLVSR